MLDLRRGVALVDQPRDELALLVGRRGLRDLERDAAGHAHDLRLDRAQRRALGRPRRPARPPARARRSRRAPVAGSCALRLGDHRAQPFLADDLRARDRDHVQPAVEDEGLGQRDRAVGGGEGPVEVAQVRVAQLVLGDVALRVRADVLEVDADDRALTARGERALRLLDQRSPPRCTCCTTTPRSSRPPPCPRQCSSEASVRSTPIEHRQLPRRLRGRRLTVRGERLVERAAGALLGEAVDQQPDRGRRDDGRDRGHKLASHDANPRPIRSRPIRRD